jgi:Family of unknown function (DUF5996)
MRAKVEQVEQRHERPRADLQWPSLMVDEWTATRDTWHMCTQIVGKIHMVHMPLINHWWQVTDTPGYGLRRGR